MGRPPDADDPLPAGDLLPRSVAGSLRSGARLSATRWTLIEAAQAGDAEAIRALCEKYRPAIVGYFARRGLRGEAEDLAQEALLALVGPAIARARLRVGKFRALVFSIARHKLQKHLERAHAAKRGAGRVRPLGEAEPPALAEPPDDDFDREWLAGLVRSALERLAREHPPSFLALKRSVLDGVPQAEVAGELGTTAPRVKKLVHRARLRVASYVREEVWAYASERPEYEAELELLSRLMGERPPS